MAHSCVVKGSEKIMPSLLMFGIVKMVWAYLWMLETCMEWYIMLSFEKLVPEPQYGVFGGN